MRRKDKQITDKQKIEEILSKSEICRLAMIDGDKPYLVPLNYGYLDNAMYIHCAPTGRKIDLLKQNNKVCFEIECDYDIIKGEMSCDWTTQYRSLIGYGTVEIITDFEQKKAGLDIIMKQFGKKDNVYKDKHVEFIVVLKINIDEISGKQSGDF